MHNVYIRPLKEEDAKISYKWRNDPEVWKYTGSRPDREITYEIENEWINRVIKDDTCRRFAIMADEVYVGNIQLTNIADKSAEYHIFIGDKKYWGKGIAYLATYYLLFYAKEELKLNKVYLSVRNENKNAIKLYQKSSFKEKSIKDDWIHMECDLSELTIPTVSVFVMVYNHEHYLAECLDGILMQKCNFAYTVVVGEDCSKDHSRVILLKYQQRYPGKFKLLLHPENIGAVKNQNEVLKNCTGRYIAMCEGDDYWTDPLKLQKQVDFLEKNQDFSLCAHRFSRLFNGAISAVDSERVNMVISLTELLNGNYRFQTATVLFRRTVLEKTEFPTSILSGDFYLFLLGALCGKVMMLKDNMSVYRKHNDGVSMSADIKKIKKDFNMLPVLLRINEKFPTNAFNAHTYNSILMNAKKLSVGQILYFYFLTIFFSKISKLNMEALQISANKTLAYRLPKNFRRIFRRIGVIKNYA